MASKRMLILRGNATTKDQANDYPDDQGKPHVWPEGALHERAARAYAKQLGYDDVMVEGSGSDQTLKSPQVKDALKKFHEDETVDIGLYGFSGGGYNVLNILKLLAMNEPQNLHRIKDVVVVGAPNTTGGEALYKPAVYIALVDEKKKGKDWKAPDWKVKYKENPTREQMPKGVTLPKGAGPHMFGPDILLSGWPDDPKPAAAPKPAHPASKPK
jgi:hypothetical protein